MSTYAGKDAATDLLLDFIAGGVSGNASGESVGNYNAVIGDAAATDDLSQKTLTEIYALQDSLKAAGRPSTAIGRYQIIKSTLQGLQDHLKLPDDTKFTNELQDRLAVELMTERGYSRWWRGAMTDEDFAHGLSLEWASLPDPMNGGKSHYDGVGPNHAGTTLAAVYAMLRSARTIIPTAGTTVPQPASAPSQESSPSIAPPTPPTTVVVPPIDPGILAKMPWWVLPGLALVVIVVFAAALIIAWKSGDNTLLTQMLTATVTFASMVLAYFFGSSAGSDKKDSTLALHASTNLVVKDGTG